MPRAVGIDLGTTYSCVAVVHNGNAEIIKNDCQNITTPSCVAFVDNQRLVGEDAKLQQAVNPNNTIFDVKRLIGRTYKDPDIQEDLKNWPFKVVDCDGRPMVQVETNGEEKRVAPEEISAAILAKLKETAENSLGQEVTQAVITVPAYFNEAQRQATKDAATISGLEVLRLLSEPTSAAIAYGLDRKSEKTKHVLVFDLGGGTFDVSILVLKQNTFNVKATDGDTHLGGEDFDSALAEHAAEEFKRKHKIDLFEDKAALGRLRKEAQKAKCTLSVKKEVLLKVDDLSDGIDFTMNIKRSKFEELNEPHFQKTLKCVERALKDAKMAKKDIDEIVLVGGSSRIPRIQEIIQQFFKKQLCQGVHPDEAVAQGAARLAESLAGQKSGAAQDIVLKDVIPLSLGVEIREGVMQHLLPRNSAIPAKVTKEFKTVHDQQDEIQIKVYEGERRLVKDNLLLGEFTVSGIPPLPGGKARILETFEVDENGILSVTAVVQGKSKEHSLRITTQNGRLSEEEIQAMIADAEKYKEEEEEIGQCMLAKSRLESCAFNYKAEARRGCVDEEHERIVLDKCEQILEWLSANPEAKACEYDEKRRELEEVYKDPENVVSGQLPYRE